MKNEVYKPLLVHWIDNSSFRDLDGNLYKLVNNENKRHKKTKGQVPKKRVN